LNIKVYILLIFIVVNFSSCRFVNYSFIGGTLDPKIQTVNIKYFPNNAALVQPTLSRSFTETLRDKFISQTKLALVEAGGDIIIKAK